jgi:hypothetical protein
VDRYFDGLWLVRLFFTRGLAALYLLAFVSAYNQFPPLLGERGLLPVRDFLARVPFRYAPSLFHWRYSDRLLRIVTAAGALLAALTLVGITERAPIALFVADWLVMWFLYLSIVNIGQTFYAFGWESMLCEAGFFAAFLGPRHLAPPWIVILILRWMLFRTELGAGLIKVRHDPCWRDLTCLYYHYETQPLPNPLSRAFHRIPKPMHRLSVVFSHFVQLVAPFGLFAPQPFASIAAALLVVHQLLLIVSGNYAFLNWLTVVLGIVGFCDFGYTAPPLHHSLPFDVIVYLLAAFTLVLSVKPALNLFARDQLMNYSWNRWHLVNAYGAFGSVTKERYEIVIEGSDDGVEWREYEFKAKPGDPLRMPPQVAPYHLRLDWLMWFLPFSVHVSGQRIIVPGYEMWFVRFIERLLEGDAATLALLRHAPLARPRFIRARYYKYEFGYRPLWWTRTLIDEYLPPLTLDALQAAMR